MILAFVGMTKPGHCLVSPAGVDLKQSKLRSKLIIEQFGRSWDRAGAIALAVAGSLIQTEL